jgi:uncharacterized membrane protein
MLNKKTQLFVTFIIILLVYGFLISRIPWNLIFLNTTTAGGDTGTHNYNAYYAYKIFPKLKWWSPDWSCGFPFLYFYPPLLYYIIAIFAHFFPINIVFKLVTLIGTFCLPFALFICLKLLDLEFPIPQLGMLLSLNFLFLEQFSIYGGNLPSTLAGEFSYSLGFSLLFVFLGLVRRVLEYKNERKWFYYALFTLALMAVIHPFPVGVAVLTIGLLVLFGWLIERKPLSENFVLIKIGVGAFLISAFWSLPFLMLLPYTAKMSWYRSVKLEDIFPKTLLFFLAFAIIGISFFLVDKKRKRLIPLICLALASISFYLILNRSRVFNARFLPPFIVSYLLFSAYGLGYLIKFISSRLKPLYLQRWILLISIVVVGCCEIFWYLPKTITYIPFWMKWNYEGFERKSTWPEISPLFDYLKQLPHGRVMVEYRPEYDKFGTPRIFENTPIFASQPTFEGLLTESAISNYFHFINQTETTKKPSAAIAGFEYPPFNFENGVKHLKLFGANYFVSYTKEIKDLADKYLKKIKDVNDFSIYEITDSYLVEVLNEIELKPKTKKWLDESIEWYKGMDFSKPIVFYQNQKELNSVNKNIKKTEPLINSVEIISLTNDSLIFKTKDLYSPHLVKISYFPGWRVNGGKGPYLITPSFMMVIPTQEEVKLEYHYNFWDKLGMILSISSITYFIFSFKIIDFLKKKRLFRFESK